MYRILPSVRVAWRDVGYGALTTALLFTIGQFLIGLYLGKLGVASGFGAAGSIVVLVVWVYYSAQIFLLGAEFTWLYAHSHGSRAAEGEAVAPSTHPREIQADPAKLPPAAHAPELRPRATRDTTPGPSRPAGTADIAIAGLIWVGFGAVRSLMSRGRRASRPHVPKNLRGS
jgi:membrane protein